MPASVPPLLHDLAVATAHVDLLVRERLGLSAMDYQALKHLTTGTPVGPAALGRLLGISSGSATGLVDRLERDGHVARRPHPADRRRQVLVVSRRTGSLIAAVLEPLVEALTAFEESFSPAEREVISRFLTGARDIHGSLSE